MLVAGWSGAMPAWERELSSFKGRLGTAFGRAELRRSAGAFLDGLLSGVSRKTGWLLAEQAGLRGPYRIQSLLGRSSWSADGLRDVVRAEVLTALGDAAGVLVVDGGTRPRPLRGAVLARLASPHDALHGRRCLPHETVGRSAPRRMKQTQRNESGSDQRPVPRRLNPAAANPPSVPEIRYLLARLLLRSPAGKAFILN